MKEEQNLNKIAKYLSENSDSKEREALFAWVKEDPANKTLLEDSMEIWEASDPSDLAFKPNMNKAWDKMDNRLTKARQANPSKAISRPLVFFRPWMRVAAAAVILLGIAFWQYPKFISSEMILTKTIAQEKTTIELPDGTKVWLNQKSSLQYEKRFNKRIVYLEGEAFFEVAKMNGKTFEIFAEDSKTSVLGTSFNVRAYANEHKVEIAVESGKVNFSAKNEPAEHTLLTQGEYAVYTKSSQEVKKLAWTKLNAAAWKKGSLRFNNSQLADVIESLERYYDIVINVSTPKIYNCIWNNTKTHEKPVLEDLFKQISYTNNLEIVNDEAGVFNLKGEGCD